MSYTMFQRKKIWNAKKKRELKENAKRLEEQKTLEMLKVEVITDEEDKFHPENLEKPVVLDSGDFLIRETVCLAVLQSDTFWERWAQIKDSIVILRFLILRNQVRNTALISMIYTQ